MTGNRAGDPRSVHAQPFQELVGAGPTLKIIAEITERALTDDPAALLARSPDSANLAGESHWTTWVPGRSHSAVPGRSHSAVAAKSRPSLRSPPRHIARRAIDAFRGPELGPPRPPGQQGRPADDVASSRKTGAGNPRGAGHPEHLSGNERFSARLRGRYSHHSEKSASE